MTCKNCIHYEVCPTWDYYNDDLYEEGKYCGGFKKFKNKDDVQKVKHGHWIDNNNGTFTCLVCGGKSSKMDYCGRCGAKMDEKDEIIK